MNENLLCGIDTGLIRGIPSRSVRSPLRLIAVPSSILSPLHDKGFSIALLLVAGASNSRVKPVIIRLPMLSASYIFARRGLGSAIFINRLNIVCALSTNDHRLTSGA